MFRAEIQWLSSGPTLKLEGRLVADWAEQARCLVTRNVLPKDLIIDLTEVSYVDSMGEQLLRWLASVRRSVYRWQCLRICRVRSPAFTACARDNRATQMAAW
jgi:ABC-type transporter Mla MlaB component